MYNVVVRTNYKNCVLSQHCGTTSSYAYTSSTGSCKVGTDPKLTWFRSDEEFHYGQCRYKIKAFVEAGGFSKKSMKCSQEFTVINRAPPAVSVGSMATTSIQTCGCLCDQGICDISVQAEKDAFKIGDPVRILAKFIGTGEERSFVI